MMPPVEGIRHWSKHRRLWSLTDVNDSQCTDSEVPPFRYSLLRAGRYDEAEDVLQRAVELAPPDYGLAQGNLEYLRSMRSEDR